MILTQCKDTDNIENTQIYFYEIYENTQIWIFECSSSPKWTQKIQQVLLIFEHEEFLQHGELSPHRSLPAEPEYNHPSFESAAAHQK